MPPSPKPGTGWNEALRQPALGQLVPTPPAVPTAGTVPNVPTRTVPPTPQPSQQLPPPPMIERPTARRKRSIVPLMFMGLGMLGSMAAAAYFAIDNASTKQKLEEANRKAITAREDFERTAGGMVAQSESEWERTKATWAAREKELVEKAKNAEQDAFAASEESKKEIERVKNAQAAAESKLTSTQSQLNSANSEVSRLRSQLANTTKKPDDVLRTTNDDVRGWMKNLLEPLPELDTREEVRVALRKFEMGKLFEAEKKRLDKSIILASGPIILGDRGREGLRFRPVILRYANLSSAMPANIVEASYAYHWTVGADATTIEPGGDGGVSSFSAEVYSDDATKELRFDYVKTNDKFRHIEGQTPFEYKTNKNHMVLAIKFKERGDLKTPRMLIYRATTFERGK